MTQKVVWKVKLGGRIESSACIIGNKYVVVGCYDSYVYFLDQKNGMVCLFVF